MSQVDDNSRKYKFFFTKDIEISEIPSDDDIRAIVNKIIDMELLWDIDTVNGDDYTKFIYLENLNEETKKQIDEKMDKYIKYTNTIDVNEKNDIINETIVDSFSDTKTQLSLEKIVKITQGTSEPPARASVEAEPVEPPTPDPKKSNLIFSINDITFDNGFNELDYILNTIKNEYSSDENDKIKKKIEEMLDSDIIKNFKKFIESPDNSNPEYNTVVYLYMMIDAFREIKQGSKQVDGDFDENTWFFFNKNDFSSIHKNVFTDEKILEFLGMFAELVTPTSPVSVVNNAVNSALSNAADAVGSALDSALDRETTLVSVQPVTSLVPAPQTLTKP